MLDIFNLKHIYFIPNANRRNKNTMIAGLKLGDKRDELEMEGTHQNWCRESPPTNDQDVIRHPIDHANHFPIPSHPTNISAHILISLPTHSIPDSCPPHELNELMDNPSPPPATISHIPLWLNEPHSHHHLDPIVCLPWSCPPPRLIQANTEPTTTSHPLPWLNKCTNPSTSHCDLKQSPTPTTTSYLPPWPDEHTEIGRASCRERVCR